ncbi:MAG: glycine--tRNA ligase subunit beta [Acidobacteria bacterium]|nr:glycine--tRNA ligase subunit beta [Acidobacteriota bacterium]
MSEFLLEILAEEIPAGVLPGAREDLLARVANAFAEARLGGTLTVHSTSRRLILVGEGVADRQPDATLEVTGPPASKGFDAEGKPTKAAEGFANAQGVSVDDLAVVQLPKGAYVVAKKTVSGRPAAEVISEILPPLVEKMTFPRMMRWGDGGPIWIRPVHSVVALLDGLVVPLQLFGVESGRTTYGHRTLAGGRIIVMGVADWFAKLRAAHVEPDLAVRRARFEEQAKALAAGIGGEPAADESLFEAWSHLVEWPGLVRGAFDEAFLELPEEILVTSMREHQKMLPIRREGALLPAFLAVCDQTGDPKGLIAQGNEWVTSARFADARFFWDDDGKTKLEDRLSRLGRLQFQETLGDYLKKTGRVQDLAERLAARLQVADSSSVIRAARLMKADLVTDMVREFPDLQGVVGGLYAQREGERDEVWQAIYDQYRPASADDASPRSDVGAVVALADRLDTLTGLFGLGLVPTGSRDPYALRRAALGVVKILLDRNWHLDVPVAISDALQLHGSLARGREEVVPELSAFLTERLRFLLEKKGHAADTIEAVLEADARDPVDAAERVAAVDAMRMEADFAPLAAAFKRMQNILAQAPEALGEPDPAKMTDEAEQALAGDYLQARGMIDDLLSQRHFHDALGIMASFGPALDRFFTEVHVMAEDEGVKANRIALLKAIRDQFARVAKFAEIRG